MRAPSSFPKPQVGAQVGPGPGLPTVPPPFHAEPISHCCPSLDGHFHITGVGVGCLALLSQAVPPFLAALSGGSERGQLHPGPKDSCLLNFITVAALDFPEGEMCMLGSWPSQLSLSGVGWGGGRSRSRILCSDNFAQGTPVCGTDSMEQL